MQSLPDLLNSDSRLQGVLCEGLDVLASIKQQRFEFMDELSNDKQKKVNEAEENIQEAKKHILN